MQVNLTVGQIKEIIKGNCSLDDSFLIKNISSLERAQEKDLAVVMERGERSVFDAVAVDKIKNSKASLLLAKKAFVLGKHYFITEDPLGAYYKLLAFLNKQDVATHDSAVIDKSALIGKNVIISAQVFIGKDVVIGDNVIIHPGVKVLDRCIIGDHTIIHAGAVIGSDGFGYSVTKTGLRKIPQIGIVRIGKHVEVGANACIDRATFDETIIGNGVKIDNFVHISHNVIVGDYTAILAQTVVAGSVSIGIGCQIGGHVAIKDNVKIGNGVKVVSKSAVMRDVDDEQIVCGVPSVPFSDWKRTSVILYRLPEIFKEFKKIKAVLDRRKKSILGRFFG
jgi:UDP-3-O-[3-hydroxymyristoyl] glucosamine N-acyltransferase